MKIYIKMESTVWCKTCNQNPLFFFAPSLAPLWAHRAKPHNIVSFSCFHTDFSSDMFMKGVVFFPGSLDFLLSGDDNIYL